MKAVFPELTYRPTGVIAEHYFRESALFLNDFNQYNGDDSIKIQ